MKNEKFRLRYSEGDVVNFDSKSAMRRHLKSEMEIWAPFLEHVRNSLGTSFSFNHGRSLLTPNQLANGFQELLGFLDDRERFNRATNKVNSEVVLPPASSSLKGQLTLGLFENDMLNDALSVYLYYIGISAQFTPRQTDAIEQMRQRGKTLVDAAPIVLALPYSRVSTAKMSGAARTAENHVKSLAEEVAAAQQTSEDYEQLFLDRLEDQKTEAARVNETIKRLNDEEIESTNYGLTA